MPLKGNRIHLQGGEAAAATEGTGCLAFLEARGDRRVPRRRLFISQRKKLRQRETERPKASCR